MNEFITFVKDYLLGPTGGVYALGIMTGSVITYVVMERFVYRSKIKYLVEKVNDLEDRLCKYEKFRDEISGAALRKAMENMTKEQK